MDRRPSTGFVADKALAESGFEWMRGGGVSVTPQPDLPDYSGLGDPNLPVHAFKHEFLDTVRDNPVTIVVAETGAGKSTQLPQYLLEAGYKKVYLTQPRRPAARNVDSRIYGQITDKYGQEVADDSVSYQTAGDRRGYDEAVINVVTDGLQLVRELHDSGFGEDEVLVIDEAHEWNTNIEVLVAWAKKASLENPNLRVVIMSATMDAEHLADYFSDVSDKLVPVMRIPGRSYETEKREKPESCVVDEVVALASELIGEDGTIPEGPNDILVFEPGKREIRDAIDSISRRLPANIRDSVKLFPLHSKLSKDEQQEAIKQHPGFLKIVVATEVAQTSLTIDGVKYVVDSGYQRRRDIDDEGTPGLNLNPVSQADCEQRAGRTGRVCNGVYTLTGLNKKTPHVLFEDRDLYPTPEILRSDVARSALRLSELGLDIADFDMYHKASRHIIELAKANLETLGAFDARGMITQTGREMDRYPVCTSSARSMVEAERYRESVRSYMAAIVAAKEAGGLQYFSSTAGKRWMDLSTDGSSDLLVQLDIFIAAQQMTKQELVDHDLDINNFERAQEHYTKVAKIAKAPSGYLQPPTDSEREDIKRCIYMGFITSVYKHEGDGLYSHATQTSYAKREISNRSSIVGYPRLIVGDPYNIELAKGLRRSIENVTIVDPMVLGGLAVAQSVWSPEEFVHRDGKVAQKQKLLFGKVDLKIVREVAATPSPRLRQEIINYAIDHPGEAQTRLKLIKKELESLAHRAKTPIKMFTHDDLIDLIERVAPVDITIPATIEDGLRGLMQENGLSLDTYISPELKEMIILNSPDEIDIGGTRLLVNYKSGKPSVKSYDLNVVLALEEDNVYLEDGREVMFVYRGKNPNDRPREYSLAVLKRSFGN